MTNAEMVVKVRSFLDESAEDFYFDDEEIYPALSDAQRELTKTIADTWFYQLRPTLAPVPKAIQPLIFADNGVIISGSYEIVLTKSIIVPVGLRWNPAGGLVTGLKPVIFITDGEVYHLLANKELSDGFYCWWNSTKAFVNPPSTNAGASYFFDYIQNPVDITASVQPTTDEVAHDAIVERALWVLLKDRETQQAQLHLQLYGQLLQGLMK